MKRRIGLMPAICVALMTSVSHADLLAYDNLVTTADEPFLPSEAGRSLPSLDDLTVSNGGQLTQVSFAIWTGSFGPPIDARILLAEDDGDGIPNFDNPMATDSLLLDKTVTSLNGGFVPPGNAVIVDVDVSADGVNLTTGSTIWAYLSLTSMGFPADAGTVFFGPIGVGSSDGLVYQRNLDGSFSSAVPPDNDTSDGLGWQLQVVPEPATALLVSLVGGMVILKRRRRSADE